jgi:hypothetical protein
MAIITVYLFSIGYDHYLSLSLGNIRLKIGRDSQEAQPNRTTKFANHRLSFRLPLWPHPHPSFCRLPALTPPPGLG